MSPFGFHPACVSRSGYPDNGHIDATNIGVTWTREGLYAFWFLIQPDLSRPVYDFTLYDRQWGSVPSNIHILGNIAPDHPRDRHGYMLPGSYLPVDETKYTAFVRATVERYDGDGIDDMPGLVNPIKHWQVSNEPNDQITSDFAELQHITYQAIKQACSDCTVLIGGVTGGPENYAGNFDTCYAPILAELGGQYVDVFDFHWYGMADGDYRFFDPVSGKDILHHIRDRLNADGFPSDLPVWITEMGSYSGSPKNLSFQSERRQAGDYFKRFVYSLSRGVKKIFPAFGLMEGFKQDNGYFDHTGLIYDGSSDPDDLGLGVKKLSYYTYKKMTEKLEGADWTTIATLHDGTESDHLYLFRVEKNGQPVRIVWWDYFDETGYTPGDTKSITLTGLNSSKVTVTTVVPEADTGQEVTDYAAAFTVNTYPVSGGEATIALGEKPVLVEELNNSDDTWEDAYNILFNNSSDLELFRQYRDEILSGTVKGKKYITLLYGNSREALEVLLENPELMSRASRIIETNRDAVLKVLNGGEGVISNTDEIVSFLGACAKKSSPTLRISANLVKERMLAKQKHDKPFLGFQLQ